MDTIHAGRVAGALMITGSLLFLVGASFGVPRVFMESDAQARLRILQEHLLTWRVAQPFYALGPIVAGVGAGVLAAAASDAGARTLFATAGVALVAGALAWSWIVSLRAIRVVDFALGRLPWWPFATYVLLTIGGLALLGIGLLAGDAPTWLAWLTLAAAVLFLVLYVATKDLPPFVFYVLLLVVGAVLV